MYRREVRAVALGLNVLFIFLGAKNIYRGIAPYTSEGAIWKMLCAKTVK